MLKINNFNTFQSPSVKNRNDKSSRYPNLKPLTADTVSFGAMKKTSFDGFDLMCINMFKAPIEKFIDKSDYISWANEQLSEALELIKYQTADENDNKERMDILGKWKKYLTRDNDVYKNNPSMSLIIFNSITKDLSYYNRNLPPLLQPRVLADTMEQISDNLKKDKNYQPNFNKMYRNNLRLYALGANKSEKESKNITKWVKIPSYENDPKNFSKNVAKLKMLSHDSWCTKSFNAKPYLKEGDFYIYLQKGKPKAAIRMVDDKIEEIQGEKNDGVVPWQYAHIISSFVHQNHLDDDNVSSKIKEAKTKLKNINILKELLNSGKEPDAKKVFEAFGILEKVNEDGTFTISEFGEFDEDFSMDKMNLDYDKLFENVSHITGDANFGNCPITKLKNLKSVGGNLSFLNSPVRDLSSLEKIGRNLEIIGTDIKTLGHIKMIGGDLCIVNSDVRDFGDLMSVKGDLSLYDTPLETTGNLQFIGGDLSISDTPLTSLGKIKTIKGDACFSKTEITDLGDLKTIGGKADFRNSKVKNVSNLESVGENIWVNKNSDLNLQNVKVGGRIIRID